MAERTGFEPATPGVTGRYSNQLNYRSEVVQLNSGKPESWWVLQGSNLRPTACKAVALPTELNTQTFCFGARARILTPSYYLSISWEGCISQPSQKCSLRQNHAVNHVDHAVTSSHIGLYDLCTTNAHTIRGIDVQDFTLNGLHAVQMHNIARFRSA